MNETELFAPYEGELDDEELAPKDAGYWKTACKIFLKNKMGVFSAIILIVMIIFCMTGENLRPYGVQDQNTAIKNEAPSKEHWFGTDQLGRVIFVRVCHGGQVSIEIGLFASLIVSLIGVIYGSISGYLGGRADMIMMRLVEVFKGIPHLVIVILLSIILDVKGILPLLLAMTIVGWVNTAQVVRGQVKQLKGQEFIMAAECLGVPARRIISHHIIPNMMGMVVVAITLDIPTFIFEEAFLSFLGIGIQVPKASWGTMCNDAIQYLTQQPWLMIFPALAISITIFSLNFIGDGLRDALDPRINKQ